MRWTLVALLLTCGNFTRAGEGFEVLLSEGMAPCTIHAQANVNQHDALDTRLQWDFGDPQGPHNTLEGFNAAHLYMRAGDYSITLTQTLGGASKTFTKKIFISANRRRAVFVSANGSDSHTGMAEGNAVHTLARAGALLTDGTMLLLHRGDVFDVDSTLTISRRNIVIGAYGDGAPPVIRPTNSSVNDLISTTQTASDIVIRDIAFDSPTPKNLDKEGAPRAVHVAGTNITLDHLTFTNVCDGANCEARPRGMLMQDCIAPTVTSLRGYLIWGNGTDLVALGNTASNSTREHIIRLGGPDHVLIAGNDFANIARIDAGDPSDIAKGVLVLQKCAFVYATGNTLRHGNLGIGPLEGPDGVKDPLAEAHCVVLERNTITAGNINIHPGAHSVSIRDNVIHLDDFPTIIATPTDTTKLPTGQPAYPNRNISDIRMQRNSATTETPNGTFFMLHPGAPAGTITLTNNTYTAPTWTTGGNQNAAVYVEGNDLNAFSEISTNTWPTPQSGDHSLIFYISPKWYDPAGYRTLEQWAKFPQVKNDSVK